MSNINHSKVWNYLYNNAHPRSYKFFSMKIFFVLVPFVFLTGCIFGQSNEVKRAEKLLNNFQCKM